MNCTIAGNTSHGPYPGGLGLSYSYANVYRTIFWGNCGYPWGDFNGDGSFTCCDVGSGVNTQGIQFNGPQVYADPFFCAPLPCNVLAGGDYYLASNSPCLPGVSPCHELIGALGQGCGAVPVEGTSWGRIKERYH